MVCGNDKKRAARGAVGLVLAQEPAATAGRSYRRGVLLGAGARLLEHPAARHLDRIVGCLGYRVGWYFGGQEVDFDTFAYAGTTDEALKQLDETYRNWNAGVRGLSDTDLAKPPVGPVEGADPFPMEGLVLHINKELIHHGAEISLLRDLYRWRD